jgi:predicted RNA-binding protein with RPS1 domain
MPLWNVRNIDETNLNFDSFAAKVIFNDSTNAKNKGLASAKRERDQKLYWPLNLDEKKSKLDVGNRTVRDTREREREREREKGNFRDLMNEFSQSSWHEREQEKTWKKVPSS